MKLITPATISLEDSTIAVDSDGHDEWSGATTYALNDTVMVTSTTPHKIYKSLQNSNTNHAPASSPTWWQDQGGTNRWKMFDEFFDTVSEDSDSIEVEISADNSDMFYLFNLDAHSVDIELTDNGTSTVVLSDTYDLSVGDGTYKTELIEQIYIYANATLKITIDKTGSTAKCGICGVGLSTKIGKSRWGVKSSILDYSIKDDGLYGTYISQGAWAKEFDVESFLDDEEIDFIYEDLVSARGSIVVLDANGDDTDYDAIRAYGFFKNWKISVDGPNHGIADITFQGVI